MKNIYSLIILFALTPYCANALTIIIPGTYSAYAEWATPEDTFYNEVGKTFKERPEIFNWSGGNNHSSRDQAARELRDFIRKYHNRGEKLNIVAHSHGGNVVKIYTNIMDGDDVKIDTFYGLGVPQVPPVMRNGTWTGGYEIKRKNVSNYLNVFSNNDRIQTRGGGDGYDISIFGNEHELEVMGTAIRTDPLANKNIDVTALTTLMTINPVLAHSELHSVKVWKFITK